MDLRTCVGEPDVPMIETSKRRQRMNRDRSGVNHVE
jgi:hypothetical protein